MTKEQLGEQIESWRVVGRRLIGWWVRDTLPDWAKAIDTEVRTLYESDNATTEKRLQEWRDLARRILTNKKFVKYMKENACDNGQAAVYKAARRLGIPRARVRVAIRGSANITLRNFDAPIETNSFEFVIRRKDTGEEIYKDDADSIHIYAPGDFYF